MSDVLVAYGVAGGAPPATRETLSVLEDGTAQAIVGSPWPDGRPLDEAGVYVTTLAPDDLEALRAVVRDEELRAAAGEYGPIRLDSGVRGISLGELTFRWGAFADPPDAVTRAEARLRDVLARVREHPVAVLRLRDGELSNPGIEPVTYRVELRTGDGDNLSAYHAATPAPSGPSQGELGPGESTAIVLGQGRNAFARGVLDVMIDDRPLALDVFVVSQSG